MLGGRVLNILDQLGRSLQGRSFDGLVNEILLVDGKISGTVVFLVGSGMFRVNEENELARLLLNFCFARTSTALNKRTLERAFVHVTLVGTPTVAVHPVSVNVASLEIVVTRRKGSVMPAFLFKSARSARVNDITSALVLPERDQKLYSFHCRCD